MSDRAMTIDIEPADTSVIAQREQRLPGHGDVRDVVEVMNDLKLIRTFIASEMIDGVDYGVIPGTGTKKNMLLPGAQKVNMFFNVRPDYQVERVEIGEGHVEFIINTVLINRASQRIVGAGVGSCSTMEWKYRYRKAERKCPQCGQAAIIKGKAEYGGGWVCFEKKGGCKAKYRDGDAAIEEQDSGQIENPNIYDIRNTVLKMAKKRSLVDASIGLGCLSELFTQDLEDIFDIPDTDTKKDTGARGDSRGGTSYSDRPVDSANASAKANDTPSLPAPSPAPVSDVQTTAIITPKSMTPPDKRWKAKGQNESSAYVYDAKKERWTFPERLFGAVEDAIRSDRQLKVLYQRKGDYKNVDAAEVI